MIQQFLFTIPAKWQIAVQTGQVVRYGAILKDHATGRIVAHLQETGVLNRLVGSVFQMGTSSIVNASPLGLVAVAQNYQIGKKLTEIQSSLGLLQNLQYGTLAVSGLGLGVSVVGFAVMNQRLKGIEDHLSSIEDKIEATTRDRRSDDLAALFSDVSVELATVDGLALRKNKQSIAETSQRSLARSAGRLAVVFRRHAQAVQTRPATKADLEMLWSLAAAIRLCHEAGVLALFHVDEVELAAKVANEQAMGFLEMSQPLSADILARACALNAKSFEEATAVRKDVLPMCDALVAGVRDSVASVSSQGELAKTLFEKQISGPDYLQAISEEKEEALLVLPI